MAASYTLISSNENQKLNGYVYTSASENDKEHFEVSAIKNWQDSYAGETVTVTKNQNPKKMQNFSSRLEQGVEVNAYDVYVGQEGDTNTYIKDIAIINTIDVKKYFQLIKEGYIVASDSHGFIMLYTTTNNYSEAIKDVLLLYDYDSSDYRVQFMHNGYNSMGRIYKTPAIYDLLWESEKFPIVYTKQEGGFNEALTSIKLVDSGVYLGHQLRLEFTKEKSNYIGTVYNVSEGMVSYDQINDLNCTGGRAKLIREAGNKLYIQPIYSVKPATVTFLAEDNSAVSFSGDKKDETGDKKDETGFKAGDVLECTQIDKVEMTAVDITKGQNIYPSNILCENFEWKIIEGRGRECVKLSSEYLYAKDQTNKASLTNTMNIDASVVHVTACYNRPALTFQYDPTELIGVPASYLNREFNMLDLSDKKLEEAVSAIGSPAYGEIMITPQDDTSKILGMTNFNNPFTLTTGDLSLLRNTYLASAMIRDDKLYYDDPVTKIPYRTITFWNYIDPKTGLDKTIKGNAFAFTPYYGSDKVEYFFQTEQRNKTQVGVTGTVYTLEEPLFTSGLVDKTVKTPAVGVDLIVGGYNAHTASNGTFSVGGYFNKGDYIALYAKYNTLTAMQTIDVNKGSETTGIEVNINVADTDMLKVKSSTMEKRELISTGKMTANMFSAMEQNTYQRQKATTMTLEDTDYYLTITAEGSAGYTPKEAEFRVYSKGGDLKEEFTKRIAFTEGGLTYELNPMSMGGGKKLDVGDTFTVTLYDTQGVEYFEHHTDIIVAEKMEGMYLFNYDSWKSDSDNLFVKAMGNISYAYDWGLDILNSDGVDYEDQNGRKHHTCSIGFGQNFKNPESLRDNMTKTVEMLDQMIDGTFVARPNDVMQFMGGSSSSGDDKNDDKKDAMANAISATFQSSLLSIS